MIKKTPYRAFRTAMVVGIISLATSSVCMAALNVSNIGGYATLWESGNCSYIGNYQYSCPAVQLEPIYVQGPHLPPPFNANCPRNARRVGVITIGAYGDSFSPSTGWIC
jgi:hypothetical protein